MALDSCPRHSRQHRRRAGITGDPCGPVRDAYSRHLLLQGQIEAKRKQLDKQKSAIEAKLKTLTPPQREAKAKEFQKKVEEFQKFGMNAEKELQTRQEEFSVKLFKAIEQASADLGKAKGLSLVVVKRELLYLGSGVDAQDVTDDVIKKIDKK